MLDFDALNPNLTLYFTNDVIFYNFEISFFVLPRQTTKETGWPDVKFTGSACELGTSGGPDARRTFSYGFPITRTIGLGFAHGPETCPVGLYV